MKITEHRTKDILNWLDDKAADHALMFEEMAMFRDAAALIRQQQAEVQDAHRASLELLEALKMARAELAGLPHSLGYEFTHLPKIDSVIGREQGRGKDHAHQTPSAPVGVEGGLSRSLKLAAAEEQAEAWQAVCTLLSEIRPGWATGPGTGLALALDAIRAIAQQPAAVDDGAVFRLAVWMAKNEGHDDPHHLIWEGSPPEPWGEVWNRYEDDARAALTAALATQHQEPTTCKHDFRRDEDHGGACCQLCGEVRQ